MRDYKKIKVWQKAHNLAVMLYKTTASFPKEEMYGLTSQIRRSGISIPANIAEGCGRSGEAELARFLQISSGSASELEYHLLFCRDIKLLKSDEYDRLVDEVVEIKKMLTTYIKKLKADS